MAEQPAGLRFDIYERVQIPAHVKGIKEWEELELTPRIEVRQQGEQAVLAGSLLLEGRYVADEEPGGIERISHDIPVEITLPMYRIRSIDDIGVSIDQFDVDMLNARAINVTGVLSLSGVSMQATRQTAEWAGESEEEVFVHEAGQAEEQAVYATPYTPLAEETGAAIPESVRSEPAEPVAPAAEAAAESYAEADEAAAEVVALDDQPTQTDAAAGFETQLEAGLNVEVEAGWSGSAGAGVNVGTNVGDEAETDGEREAEAFVPLAAGFAAELPEEKAAPQEPRIAFGSRKEQDQAPAKSASGTLESLIRKPAQAAAEQANTASAGKRQLSADALEWKNLLLAKDGGDLQFRKVRMCIVQREETIETIAERYRMNPRQLQLYNRLGDNRAVSEGQLLYIPVT